MKARFAWLFAAALSLNSCGTNMPAGPMQHDTRSIPRDTAESARVDLHMGGGELRINGGAQDLMLANFDYNVPSWKPEVHYDATAGVASLRIEQPSGQNTFANATNKWDVRLNDEVATAITVRLGGGEAHLDMGTLSLRNVEIEMGAGEMELDLRGMPRQSYNVRVRGGAGEATVHLPKNVGVYAQAEGVLGDIKVTGLRREEDHWISDGYGYAKVQIHLDVRGGVGQINLFAD
jgi:hypothetical protein